MVSSYAINISLSHTIVKCRKYETLRNRNGIEIINTNPNGNEAGTFEKILNN